MSVQKDFYRRFGLIDNPFSTFTSENENNIFDKLFVSPNNYDSIIENFNNGNSIILTGDRGTGKTAVIKDIISKKNDNLITTLITDYSDLSQNYTSHELYKFIISNISFSLFTILAEETSRIRKLNKENKLLLCYLLKNFVPQISKSHLKDQITKIQIPIYKRLYKNCEKFFRSVFNYGATVGSSIVDEYIAKHFTGMPPLSESVKIKDFFPELPLNVDEDFEDQDITYNLLKRISTLVLNLGYKRTVIIFDKVDEDSRFANDAEEISEFILPILSDNKFLLEDSIQVVFSTWVTPFNYIKSNVRTQKHYCPNLSWSKEDLEKVLNQRLKVFSKNKLNSYKSLFNEDVTEADIEEIFNLSNRNPRDLWHIFSALFNSQFNKDSNVSRIMKSALEDALVNFVTTFNYYEYYPRKSNARANSMDIYSYAKHLLKLDSEIFNKNQLNEKAQTGGSTNNYVVGMEKIGLIGVESQSGGVVSYKIKDNKIVYALRNQLEIRKD